MKVCQSCLCDDRVVELTSTALGWATPPAELAKPLVEPFAAA